MTIVVFLGLAEVMVDPGDSSFSRLWRAFVRGSYDRSYVPRIGRGCERLRRDIIPSPLMMRDTVCLLHPEHFGGRAYSITMES
ncbi:hypothetical protein DPMN_109783 [Dreissena polymorpha]|uniref:Uncharacterized protein n=1 Tax=Dreissena polymorpha TaxID=45954 RepID=A0A9D4QMC3_DREPO|nr:hypothetical protein DPMN_109783 [Dreissena polymorpha]